jgi:hypothetical protein
MARPYLKIVCFLDHNHCVKMANKPSSVFCKWLDHASSKLATYMQESKGVEYDGKDH